MDGGQQPSAPPLHELFEAVSARVGGGLGGLIGGGGDYCLPDVRRPYLEVCRLAPDSEPAARAIMAPLVGRSCADLDVIRSAARDDPAAPGMEEACCYLLQELGWLAAVYVTTSADRRAPDPDDEYSGDYNRVCESIRGLTELMGTQRDLWRFFRESRAAARGRPPPRPHRRRPMADDREYYF